MHSRPEYLRCAARDSEIHCTTRREGCNRWEAGDGQAEGRGTHWIPGRICLLASKDLELTQYILDTVFKNGLVSNSLEVAVAAQRWQSIYLWCKPEVSCQRRHICCDRGVGTPDSELI